MNKQELQLKANEVRKGIVTAVHAAKAGHPGGSLSAADIFTYLYFEELNIDHGCLSPTFILVNVSYFSLISGRFEKSSCGSTPCE